ncbi:MAG: hypothetical protein HY537_04115 [Deltaproteobacteria bacterium]|nr:hypothetical protein [Deltaproteobacteria bacterium]
MRNIFVVMIFIISLVLKVSAVAGAEGESSGSPELVLAKVETSSQNTKSEEQSAVVVPSTESDVAIVEETVVPAETATLAQVQPVAASDSSSASSALSADSRRVSVTPMVGGTAYAGRWYDHIANAYTVGLALDLPISPLLSIEAEGDYGRFDISYRGLIPHYFNQYQVGGNLKLSPLRNSVFHPFIGAGMMALHYENMFGFNDSGYASYGNFSRWIGAGQMLVGADVTIMSDVAAGLRASYAIPLLNRPTTVSDNYQSYPGWEDAGAINTNFYRILGTVRVNL